MKYLLTKVYWTNEKTKSKFQKSELVRAAVLNETFSKGDTTNWIYKMYKITEIVKDTIPSYKINQLPERYNEALLKKTQLSLKVDNEVIKALNLN